jgi:SOS-response transcriptional repressor LexA
MPIQALPNDHALHATQTGLLQDIIKLKQELAKASHQNIADNVEILFEEYFKSYNIDDSEEISIEKLNALKLKFSKLLEDIDYLKETNAKEILKKLSQFQPIHIAYYKAKRELENTIADEQYDNDLRQKGKDVLREIDICHIWRPSENDEKTFTALLATINQGIKTPTDENNFSKIVTLLPRLPKQKIYVVPIINALMGSLMIFVGALGLATSIASMILTGGASAPGAVFLAALSIGIIALGSAWIHKRDDLFQHPLLVVLPRILERDSIRNLHTTCRLFKEKQNEHVKRNKPQNQTSRLRTMMQI